MPKGDRFKLKADPEDGTTPIANLLLEAVAMAKLSGLQVRAILYLWRKTYGWADSDGKRVKESKIGLTEWALALDSNNATLSRTLQELQSKGIIKRRLADVWGGYFYSLNTNISKWNSDCINQTKLCAKIGIPSFATVDPTATIDHLATLDPQINSSQQDNSIPKHKTTVDQIATILLTKSQPPSLYKERLKKDKEIKDKIKRVFEILDKERPYKLRNRKEETASIKRMLEQYTVEQITSTWLDMKKDKFWQGKELFMMTVENQIGAKLKDGAHKESNKGTRKSAGDTKQGSPTRNYTGGKYGHLVQ